MKRRSGTRVAVIGAGIAGLAAAYELKKRGIAAVVFEKEKCAGGRMATEYLDGLAFDSGADFFSQNYRTIKGYASKLGIDWAPTRANSRHRVIRGRKPFYLKFATLGDLARFKLLSPWSRWRLTMWLTRLVASRNKFDLFDLSSIPASYDFDNASDYIGRTVSQEAADYIIDSFTSLMQFHRAKEISTAGLFGIMHMMISPKHRFALCSTPEGLSQIPQALAEKLTVRYGRAVESVNFAAGNTVAVKAAKQKPQRFDAAILAVPAPVVSRILPKNLPWRKFFSTVRYASTIVLAFRVPSDLFADGTHLSYVPFVESKLIGGYTNEGVKEGKRNYNGETLLNVYLQEESARKMMAWPDTKIYKVVFSELMKVCPEVRDNLTSVAPAALARWPLAMPKFDHGHVSRAREFLTSHQGNNRLYFAGDYLNAPWTEGAARSGQRAAAAVINRLS